MAHKIQKQYVDALGYFVVVCTCGWMEKAYTKAQIDERMKTHAERPHR